MAAEGHPADGPRSDASASVERSHGLTDQLVVEQCLALVPADRDDLVTLAQDRVRPKR